MARQKRSELPFWATKEGREAANKPTRYLAEYQSHGHTCTMELKCNTEAEARGFLEGLWGLEAGTYTMHKVM